MSAAATVAVQIVLAVSAVWAVAACLLDFRRWPR